MKGLPYGSKAQWQLPRELWRRYPYEVNEAPSWVGQHNFLSEPWRKKKSSSVDHISSKTSSQVRITTKLLSKFFFPSKLHTNEAPLRVTKTSSRSYSLVSSPSSSSVDHSPKTPSWVKTNRTRAHIMRELNMQAHHTDLCTYLEGIEYACTVEEVEIKIEIEIETEVTSRQEPFQNK